MKRSADDQNEIGDLSTFCDAGQCHITAVARFEPDVASAVVETLSGIVKSGHKSSAAMGISSEGFIRAQTFEEGDVYMLESPFDGYFADRYLMDFYDVTARQFCSRMHLHTGLRFVRMMTGPQTCIRVSSYAPFVVTWVDGVTPWHLQTFTDYDVTAAEGAIVTRYNTVVDENCWVDLQIPRGVSHQFNAIGPNAVIDSVHPEESIEVFRERMSGYKMMAQTIFLADSRPAAASCVSRPEVVGPIGDHER